MTDYVQLPPCIDRCGHDFHESKAEGTPLHALAVRVICRKCGLAAVTVEPVIHNAERLND